MLEVYHGSTVAVVSPLVLAGRPGLDFGRGFYFTDFKSQAENWAKRSAARLGSEAVVSVYDYDKARAEKEFKCLFFPEYDKLWLDFIAGSRSGETPWKEYDVIEGGVADDRVIDTVEAYVSGMMSSERALERLSMFQPNKQICILNQEVAELCLFFKNAYTVKE